ncbi:hypothetical protein DFH06DRAFT_400882 [Mycena polygramma]|nr:hypothetical protein DFH06DRAFT_400882 [Mycena polygramma]
MPSPGQAGAPHSVDPYGRKREYEREGGRRRKGVRASWMWCTRIRGTGDGVQGRTTRISTTSPPRRRKVLRKALRLLHSPRLRIPSSCGLFFPPTASGIASPYERIYNAHSSSRGSSSLLSVSPHRQSTPLAHRGIRPRAVALGRFPSPPIYPQSRSNEGRQRSPPHRAIDPPSPAAQVQAREDGCRARGARGDGREAVRGCGEGGRGCGLQYRPKDRCDCDIHQRPRKSASEMPSPPAAGRSRTCSRPSAYPILEAYPSRTRPTG